MPPLNYKKQFKGLLTLNRLLDEIIERTLETTLNVPGVIEKLRKEDPELDAYLRRN